MVIMTQKLLHARYWKADGTGENRTSYDPHGFGLKTLETMDALINSLGLKQVEGVSLNGVLVNHHKGDSFGHQVHIAATAEQWEAAKQYWESGAFD
jgi:hypothetical protein